MEIFSEKPISFKLKKQILLFDYCIRERDEFFQNVSIFPCNNKQNSYNLYKKVLSDWNEADDLFYVIIDVPAYKKSGMKNYLISSKNEFSDFYFTNIINSKNEVWVCSNKINTHDCLAGRYRIDLDSGIERQLLEIVTGNYPRNIEKGLYNVYERDHWGMSYKPIKICYDISDMSICNIFSAIERKREHIESFCVLLEKYSINCVSFDFKCQNGNFVVIDFDTSNDGLLISKYFQNDC